MSWIFDLAGQLIMDGKFEFIANCTVQFNSIVSGWARERCRMCDRNSAEFSSGGDFSSETKRFFPPELSLSSKVTLLLTSFVPPEAHKWRQCTVLWKKFIFYNLVVKIFWQLSCWDMEYNYCILCQLQNLILLVPVNLTKSISLIVLLLLLDLISPAATEAH